MPIHAVITHGKYDTLEAKFDSLTFVNGNDEQVFRSLVTKYKWAFIVYASVFTITALMAFFG